MKLKTAILASLMATSPLAGAATTEGVDVNVEVKKGNGTVVVVKEVNGQSQTFEDTFVVGPDTDIDAEIAAILAAHGVADDGDKQIHKEVIRLGDGSHNKMVWVQKSGDIDMNLANGQATVVLKKDHNGNVETIERTFDVTDGTDINVLVDELMAEHGIEAGDAEVHRKVIKLDRNVAKIADDKPRFGFMASVKDNGWEIMSVVPDSGAAEAGIQKGDVVVNIDGQSTAKSGLGLTEFIAMDHQAGDVSVIEVLRDGQTITMDVTAKVLDSPDIIMELSGDKNWFSSSGQDFKFGTGDLDSLFEGLHVDVAHLDQMVEGLGDHDIRVVTTGDHDAYFFSGSKMNQWLGSKHHFSTVTESLGKYFGTSQGVLVLEVDQDNKLGLQDGDVILSINGQDVKSPKDVVKIMSQFKADESFEIEIIREKETLYLES
ncbi:PDZ domain-containing protein [Marinicella meishanensis]|uniref:PDZ domain-containing protein n=1 Tax=Marinicella meishanensis TaxID=2873263 RepID=UPI001CBF8584|nr:PDZ domain-containing protein [Marinicella sp. NBU2979]